MRGMRLIALLSSLLLLPAAAWAGSIPVDLTITGNIEYSTADSYSDASTSHSGDLKAVFGGVTSTTSFSDGGIDSGSNPLPLVPGTFTMTGDGLGIDGFTMSGSGDAGDMMEAYVDLGVDLWNTSGTETYDVVFRIAFSNLVNGEVNSGLGDDAYVYSAFTVDEDATEVFFTDLESDLAYGDRKNGTDLGTYGDTVTDSGPGFFTVTLAPGAHVVLTGLYAAEGGSYGVPDDEFYGAFSGFLSIDEVNRVSGPGPGPVVPLPAPAWLGLALLAGLGAVRRLRRR